MGRAKNYFDQKTAYALGAAILGSCCTVPAFGQSAGQKDINEINLTLDVTHDSNVARSDLVNAALRGVKQSDERLAAGIQVLFGRELGRNTISLDGFVGYDFYRRNTQLNRERIGIGAALGLRAGPCEVNLTPRIDRHQSDLSSIYFVNLPGIDSVKNTETVQTYGGDVRCGRVFGLRPLLGYSRTIGDNSNAARQISNYRSSRYSGGFAYDNPVAGKYSLTLERENIFYPDRAGGPLAAVSGYRTDQLKLHGERKIGTILTARGSFGYSQVKPKSATVQSFKGISWSLSGTIVPLPRLQLTFGTERAISPSLGVEALYSRNKSYDLSAVYALTSRTSLSAGVNYEQRQYRGASALFGPLLDNDKVMRARIGADYKASRRFKIGLEGGYERRNANGTIYDFDSTFVAVRTRFTL